MLTKSPYRCPGDEDVIHQACVGLVAKWARPVDEHVAQTSLGETYLLSVGPAQGRPIIVLAGGDLPAAGLRDLADAFSPSDRVIIVDLPGLPGASACTRPDSKVHRSYGRWLTEIFDALEIEKAPVLGLGWAGSAAAAIDDPDRIEKLVLAAPLGLTPRVRWHRALIPGLQWRNEPSLENTERYLRALAGPEFDPTDAIVRWSCRMGAYCTPLGGMPRIGRDVWQRWRDRDVEIVVGRHDPLVQVAALRKFAADTNAEVHVVDDGGRLLALEAPELLASRVGAPVR